MKTPERLVSLKSERGAAMLEYSLSVALIAVVVLAAAGIAGKSTNLTFGNTAKQIARANCGIDDPTCQIPEDPVH